MMLLGPQLNNTPSKSHVVLLFGRQGCLNLSEIAANHLFTKNEECGKSGVWQMGSVANRECGKCGMWQMGNMPNGECGKWGLWKMDGECGRWEVWQMESGAKVAVGFESFLFSGHFSLHLLLLFS